MEKFLVYYPFPIAKNPNSGSKIRPIRMIESFKEYGEKNKIEIITISGESSERKKQINHFLKNTNLQDVNGCYVENQTIPFWLTNDNHLPTHPFMDRNFFKTLRQHGIPIGLFYRDVYWKFDDILLNQNFKTKVMKYLYEREEAIYNKYVDVLFLPSMEMDKHVNIANKTVELPPGGPMHKEDLKNRKHKELKAIYVGGISERYGVRLLLESIHLVNKQIRLPLTLVCREHELIQLPDELKNLIEADFIHVIHASGDQLLPHYQDASFGIIPILRGQYNDFAIPVKLFEYLSNQLPVVATNLPAQSRIIRNDKLGIVSNDNPTEFSNALLSMCENYSELREIAYKHFIEKHTWLQRATTVIETLSTQK